MSADDRAPRSRHVAAMAGIAACGGTAGAVARHLVAQAWPAPDCGPPLATLAVNLAGSVLIGVLVAAAAGPRPAPPWVRQLLGTGFLGGFTTYSAHVLDTGALTASGRVVEAAAYMALTLVGAVAGTALGAWATGRAVRALARRRRP
ncbi:fluoride efflux transporter CrcB [Nocardiopsis dassonvillei]|uniref:fluoride efflux transporter CrcB n=1 Tax=Nocardiopsis dassonvillei TaxID=2014 RepID=UPI000B9D7E03|nr:fluoride efflux transporter CrcB [Nocardiopsis dassonvillei]ASU56750.1 CrcB protein [Nocardiopsis dassonvillei]